MTEDRATIKAHDKYREHVIARVEDSGGRPVLHFADGCCFSPAEAAAYPIPPQPGMTARLYGKGFGYPIRGLDIDGREVYYRTEAEDAAKHAEDQAKHNAEKRAAFERDWPSLYARSKVLPEPMAARIHRFMVRSAEWGWQFYGYELFCCEQAVALHAALGDDLKDARKLNAFRDLPWSEQRARVPAISDDHSGNTFGFSLRLAMLLACRPDAIVHEHGALCPLVGCKDYGCWAADVVGQAEAAANQP